MATKTKKGRASTRPTRNPKTLNDLRQDPKNARRHTDRNLAMINDSLELVGAGRSLVIDERSTILAGNATQRQALARGMKLKVVDGDRHTIVAVRRTDLNAKEKTQLALLDNRAAELAEWDPAVLRELAAAGHTAGMWSDGELGELLAGFDEAEDGLTDPDHLPAMRKTAIKRGDLFQLGEHRLLCGDSTKAEYVKRLMGSARASVFATDPPYLVDYTTKVKAAGKHTQRDDADSTNWDDAKQGPEFFDAFIARARELAIKENAAWYCWHASRRQAMLEASWEKAGAFVHQQIIWVKTRATFGRSVYMWRHEPCFFGWMRSMKPLVRRAPMADGNPTTAWQPRSRKAISVDELVPSSVWLIPSGQVETVEHPTSKPVAVFVVPILMHSVRGDVCYEPFSGSGSQIIAAEQTGRRCHAMEFEPKYCQLAIDRWEKFTGKKAKQIGYPIGTGQPHGKRRSRVA
jgi:DNA modification methylase